MTFVIIQLAGFKVLKFSLKSFKCIKTRTDVRTVAFFFFSVFDHCFYQKHLCLNSSSPPRTQSHLVLILHCFEPLSSQGFPSSPLYPPHL